MGRPHDNPTGRPLSGAERDGLVTYRPSCDGQRSTYRVTEDDAEVIAAEPSAAQRHRIAAERGLQGPVPRARAVIIDGATGAPRKSGDLGATSTGRYVATIDGQDVEVDPEDIILPTRTQPPARGGLRFDYGAPAGYIARARRLAAEASGPPKAPKSKPTACPPRAPGIRATFKSSAEAAKAFYDGNALFFDHVRDPYDGLRDAFDGIEVRSGKRHKKLGQTKKGQAILEAPPAEAIRKTLQVIFGRTRSRRWEEVDWPLIERLGEALQPYFEPCDPREPNRPGLYWRPFLGELDADALAELDPDTLARVADCESRRELAAGLERLRKTYEASRTCLSPRLRRMVERRLQEWETWHDDPSVIPVSACAPDPHTGGMTCDYPALFAELRQLQAACEAGYNPLWTTHHEGEPGFPDFESIPRPNPEEPPPEAAAAAADDSHSDAPLRVVYSYDAGILVCGETYPHRQAIKSLRTKRFKFSRRLPDDCAWYVPRTRERHVARYVVEQIADELRQNSGVQVDVEYTAADPNNLTSMEDREDAAAERAEARADRLELRAANKESESEAAYASAKSISDGIPFGQPVLMWHHSAKRHLRDLDKIQRGMRKSVDAHKESKQLERRAEASRRESQRRKDPNFAQRRIEELKTELRGLDVTLTGDAPANWRGFAPEGPATGEYKAQLQIRRAEIVDQLGYWQQLVDESGVKVWGPEDFQPGDVLAYRNGGFDIVVRVNKKTLSIDSPPHLWDLKKPYTDITHAPVRGTKAWRKAIEFYLNWLENREPQPRVFPKRIAQAHKWLAAADESNHTSAPTRSVADFKPGDVVLEDTGRPAVVVDIKPRALVVEAKNRDTGQLQRFRLRPDLIRDVLQRESDAWRDALQDYLREIPDTDAHAQRRQRVRDWLGLPAPQPASTYEARIEEIADALGPDEAAALVDAHVHGTVPSAELAETLIARRLLHPQLRRPTDLGHLIGARLRLRPAFAPQPVSDERVVQIAEELREGEVAALVRAHRGGEVYGSILRGALHARGLFDGATSTVTPLGHRVATALLEQRPGLSEGGPANARPSDPPNAIRALTGWPDSELERKHVAAALRKLFKHRHPEVPLTIRTPNYSMASTIDLRTKDGRRWTDAERSVLRAVFGPDLAISGNDATVSPWDRVHEGGTLITEPYVQDFKTFLAGKKPATGRRSKKTSRKTPAAKTSAPKQPTEAEAAAAPPTTDMKQISIWEVPVPKTTKNPGQRKTKAAPKPKPKPKTKPKSKKSTSSSAKRRPRRATPEPNPSRSYHLVAADQAIEKAERMLALAEKAPKDSISQRSAAMQAHAEATLAHQHAGYVLDHGPAQPTVRDKMSGVKRKAFSVARKAQVIVGAEKPARRRAAATPNPGKPPRARARANADAERARRALRRL